MTLPKSAFRAFAFGAAVTTAVPVVAQEVGPFDLSFGIDQRLEFGRNLALSVPSEGSTTLSATTLSIGLSTATALESFELGLAGALLIENGPATSGTDLDFGRPQFSLSYSREIPNAVLSFDADYESGDVDDLSDDLADRGSIGEQTNYSASLRYETGRTAPASLFGELEFDAVRYDGTIDPTLVESDTVGLTVGTRLRFSPVFSGIFSIGQSREEDEFGAITMTDRVEALFSYALQNGVAEAEVVHESGDTEDRLTVEFGRIMSLPDGALSVRLGVTDSDRGGTDVIGGVEWSRELPTGSLTASVSRAVTFDGIISSSSVDTDILLGYVHNLSGVSSISVEFEWEQSETSLDLIEETQLTATYSTALASAARFDIGVSHRVRDESGVRAESPLVFLALGRDF